MWLLIWEIGTCSAADLETYLRAAMTNNPDIAAAGARADFAQAGVTIARSSLLPSISVTGTYTRNDHEIAATLPLPTGAKELVITPLDQLDARARLTVPLLVPSAIAATQAASAQRRAGEANQQLTQETILFSVIQVYYGTIASHRVALAAKESEIAAEANLAVAQARFELNSISALDLRRVEAEVARAKQTRLAAEADERDGLRNLAALTGIQDASVGEFTTRSVPIGDLLAKALIDNPQIQASEALVRAAKASRASVLWGYSPSVAGFGQIGVSNATGFSGEEVSAQAGLQLQWNILDGGAREGRISQAKSSVIEAESKASSIRTTITDDVAAAIDARSTAEALLDASKIAAEATLEARKLAEERFMLGELDAAQLATARRDAFEAEVQIARAEANLAIATEQLRFLIGEPFVKLE